MVCFSHIYCLICFSHIYCLVCFSHIYCLVCFSHIYLLQAQSVDVCEIELQSVSLGVYELGDIRQIFQTSRFQQLTESEEKQISTPIKINITQYVRTQSYNIQYPVDSFKAIFQALQQKDFNGIGNHVKTMKQWNDVDSVFVAMETLKPNGGVWNGNIAERFVINAAPRVLNGYKAQCEALNNTRSVKLREGLKKSLETMNAKMNVLVKEIRRKGDDCNPHLILPQKQYAGNMIKYLVIDVDKNEMRLRGDKKAASYVQGAIQWLQRPLLSEVLWDLKKEFDTMDTALKLNGKIKVHEDLYNIMIALMERYADESSIPGFGSLPFIWIKLTAGKAAMKTTVQLLENYLSMYSIEDATKILMLLCEASISIGDNFIQLQKLILAFSRYVTCGLASVDAEKCVKEHWDWVTLFLHWCYDKYAPAGNVEDATKIVTHVKELHTFLGLFAKAGFAGGILRFLCTKEKLNVPQTFVDYIENDLDLRGWRYDTIVDV